MWNIASFGVKFFYLRMKRLPSKFIFSTSSWHLLSRIANLKFNHSTFEGELLKKCQKLEIRRDRKNFLNFFQFFNVSYIFILSFVRKSNFLSSPYWQLFFIMHAFREIGLINHLHHLSMQLSYLGINNFATNNPLANQFSIKVSNTKTI